jgi:hypothetical protein
MPKVPAVPKAPAVQKPEPAKPAALPSSAEGEPTSEPEDDILATVLDWIAEPEELADSASFLIDKGFAWVRWRKLDADERKFIGRALSILIRRRSPAWFKQNADIIYMLFVSFGIVADRLAERALISDVDSGQGPTRKNDVRQATDGGNGEVVHSGQPEGV